jgi:hypothetical protein
MDDGYCSAAAVEIDPDSGCATYSPSEEAGKDEEWEEEELDEWEEDLEEDDEEDWIDDDEESY